MKTFVLLALCACLLVPCYSAYALENNTKLADHAGTGKLIKGYVSDGTYVAWIVDDLGSGAGDEVWYYNLTTGTKVKITGTTGYSTLSDDIYIIDGYAYWVANSNGYKIYRYKLSGGTVSEYFSMSSIGDLEKTAEMTKFTMVNANFFEYTLKYYSANPLKQYDIANKKGYGNVKSDFTILANGSSSTTVNKNKEIFWMTGDVAMNDLNVADWAYLDGRYLFYTIDDSIALDNNVSQYRLFDTVTGTRTVLKTDLNPNVSLNFSPALDGDYVVARQNVTTTNEGTYEIFLRLNYKTGNLVYPALVQNTTSGTVKHYSSALLGSGENIVWRNDTDSKNHLYYDVSDNQFCTYQKSDLGSAYKTYKNFILTAESNTLYYNKIVCQGATDESATTDTSTTQTGSTGESQLIKTATSSAVYYKGADGKRYVFFNATHFYDWYADFKTVKTISTAEMADIMIGGNVTFRPGSLAKVDSSNKVYAVGRGGTLRWLKTEAVAKALYGSGWAKLVKTIPDTMFTSYKIGSAIESVADFNPTNEKLTTTTINQDKSL